MRNCPPSATPLITSATALGTTDLALAGALAASGLLSTYAESSSTGAGTPSAQGSASYRATWNHTGGLFLNFDFTTGDFTDPAASSLGQLIIHMTSGGLAVFDRVLSTSETISQLLFLDKSPDQLIEVTLRSQAFGASAFYSAVLSFDAALVPEPGTWPLIVGAGVLMLVVKRRPALHALSERLFGETARQRAVCFFGCPPTSLRPSAAFRALDVPSSVLQHELDRGPRRLAASPGRLDGHAETRLDTCLQRTRMTDGPAVGAPRRAPHLQSALSQSRTQSQLRPIRTHRRRVTDRVRGTSNSRGDS